MYKFSPKCTYIGYKEEVIHNNDTGFTDDEVREVLRNYDVNIKKPIKGFLLTYYRVKFNPDLKFGEYFLESLGFKPCEKCVKVSE